MAFPLLIRFTVLNAAVGGVGGGVLGYRNYRSDPIPGRDWSLVGGSIATFMCGGNVFWGGLAGVALGFAWPVTYVFLAVEPDFYYMLRSGLFPSRNRT